MKIQCAAGGMIARRTWAPARAWFWMTKSFRGAAWKQAPISAGQSWRMGRKWGEMINFGMAASVSWSHCWSCVFYRRFDSSSCQCGPWGSSAEVQPLETDGQRQSKSKWEGAAHHRAFYRKGGDSTWGYEHSRGETATELNAEQGEKRPVQNRAEVRLGGPIQQSDDGWWYVWRVVWEWPKLGTTRKHDWTSWEFKRVQLEQCQRAGCNERKCQNKSGVNKEIPLIKVGFFIVCWAFSV